jgi:shikimate kinase
MGTPNFPNIILLTGPKHSGKTSTGKALAGILNAEFIDLDDLIKDQTGRSPRELYREGPESFRAAEAKALESLLSKTTESGAGPVITAAGGGLIDNEAAMARLNAQTATVMVYLEVSAKTAWERIQRAAERTGELPPFLDTDNPRETHARLHTRRAEAYRARAAIIIDTDSKNQQEQGREIAERLSALYVL